MSTTVYLKRGESVSLTTGQVTRTHTRTEANAWDTARFKIMREGLAKNDLRALACEFAEEYVTRNTGKWFR